MKKILISSLSILLLGISVGNGTSKELKVKRSPQESKGPFKLSDAWPVMGFIPQWLVCGYFPNPGGRPDPSGWDKDYLKDLGGEEKIEPYEGMAVKYNGNELNWTAQKINSKNCLDFQEIFDRQDNVLAYACCYLEVESDIDILALIGSDDGYKLWCNHELAATNHVYRGSAVDQESILLHLNKGMNILLLKVDNDIGQFNFYFRIVDIYQEEIEKIKIWN